MKNFVVKIDLILVFLICLFVSCTSSKNAYRPLSEVPDVEILDGISVYFVSTSSRAN